MSRQPFSFPNQEVLKGMDFSFSPPEAILFIGLGALLLLILSALRGRGNRQTRLVRLLIGTLAIGGILFFAYRPIYVTVNSEGIRSNRGTGIALTWSKISGIVYLADLTGSSYRLTAKLEGVALGSYRVGLFRTSGGQSVRVIAQRSDRALLIESDGKLYELAPSRIERMVAEVARYRPVNGWPQQK